MPKPQNNGEVTHQEIADVLGCSRQNVHLIEKKALKKIRRMGKLERFRDGLIEEPEINNGDAIVEFEE